MAQPKSQTVRIRRHPVAFAPWQRDELRTTLWLVPSLLVAAVIVLFAATYSLDRAADAGHFSYPSWVNNEGPDAARQVLIAIAAAVITTAGVVFSVTILALTLASQQFGPRMLRNFIRDIGTQVTLGVFVATFVYSVLALGSVANEPGGAFVPHLSVTVALALTLASLGVLIYFIHHVAASIQLNSVVAGVAGDFQRAVEALYPTDPPSPREVGLSVTELSLRLEADGANVPATTSGFLQAIGRDRLVGIATSTGSVICLLSRPGHFLVEGRPLARVWPSDAAPAVAKAFQRAHAVGPHRTLTQDPGFAIDQLVEIALRALSPAVNDTFTALICIDWLGDGLCKLSARTLPGGVYRDTQGEVRLIEPVVTYHRLLKGAFDKIRQAGRGMPAVGIRQLENLTKIAEHARDAGELASVRHQAEMIMRSADEAIAEPSDRQDVRFAYSAVVAAIGAHASSR